MFDRPSSKPAARHLDPRNIGHRTREIHLLVGHAYVRIGTMQHSCVAKRDVPWRVRGRFGDRQHTYHEPAVRLDYFFAFRHAFLHRRVRGTAARGSVSERVTRAERLIDRAFGAVHRLADRCRTRVRGLIALGLGYRRRFADVSIPEIPERAFDQQRHGRSARTMVPGADGNNETSVFLSLIQDLPPSEGILA